MTLLMDSSLLFLLFLLLIGLVAKNQSLMIAVAILLVLKITPIGEKVFPYIQGKGINIGITIITLAVLIPIATGDIGFKEIVGSLKSIYAWIAVASGIAVAMLAKGGVAFLAAEPQMTASLVLGTILAVAVFKGVAVGPLIGAGIAYMVMQLVHFFKM